MKPRFFLAGATFSIFPLAFSFEMQYTRKVRHGDVAQLGERSVRIREVESSILFVSTILDSSACLYRLFCVIDETLALRERGYGLLVKEAIIANNDIVVICDKK